MTTQIDLRELYSQEKELAFLALTLMMMLISMGGTYARLIDQGHDVHVAYQTSGNIANKNEDTEKFIEVMYSFISSPNVKKVLKSVKDELGKKKIGDK